MVNAIAVNGVSLRLQPAQGDGRGAILSRVITVSYAGMSRIRFDGLADASQPRKRAPQRYVRQVALSQEEGKLSHQTPSLELIMQAGKVATAIGIARPTARLKWLSGPEEWSLRQGSFSECLRFLHAKASRVPADLRDRMGQHNAPLHKPFWVAPHRRSKVCLEPGMSRSTAMTRGFANSASLPTAVGRIGAYCQSSE